MSVTEFFKSYDTHVNERADEGIPPLPLNPEQTHAVIEGLKDPSCPDHARLLGLLTDRVPPGVDPSSYIKAGFLSDIAKGDATCLSISATHAIEMLGDMHGGYNVTTLVAILKDDALGAHAANALKGTLLMFDAFHEVKDMAKHGNAHAQSVLESWADAEWFTSRASLDDVIDFTVFRVPGEVNTDDLSPAPDAWSRPDIPMHALAMLKYPREGVNDPLTQLTDARAASQRTLFVADVLGTGSSRKSATNSMLWYIGDDMPGVPNKRSGGFCVAGKIAPIFYNTCEDAGTLPIEMDVTALAHGRKVQLRPFKGDIVDAQTQEVLSTFSLNPTLLDQVRAGSRLKLIIGRELTSKACEALGRKVKDGLFSLPGSASKLPGYTLAQKMVGAACGLNGVAPGESCEPRMSTVGSQDTTGPMTKDELTELACLGFSADFVLQSFCHTVAYPKPVDIKTRHTLPDFFITRGGVSLRPGDGIIHSWLNRMLLPDQVGTGGDSHTRFPLGISFPAGSGMVAFAAATGAMPLTMPESVRVRFTGTMQPGITLRDLVHAIPYAALQSGDLTVGSTNKKNVFSGRCLEVEGLGDLKIEQAFEISDASAERSASGCTIRLNQEPIKEYLRSNVVLIEWMIANGYKDMRTLWRRKSAMEEWLKNPTLMEPDDNAEYAASFDINLDEITEPLLCCPNDPDNVKPLSEVAGTKIDEVFIGSCMTNIGHFRAAAQVLKQSKDQLKTRLWVVPPTKMDQWQLIEEGFYAEFGAKSARTEVPGCSLCMGNQARVAPNSTVVSTSTRNFPNRLGDNADTYLASAELCAVAALLGRLPTLEEYREQMAGISTMGSEIYRYLNFNEIDTYMSEAAEGRAIAAQEIVVAS